MLLTESAMLKKVSLPCYSSKFSFSFAFQYSSGNIFSNVKNNASIWAIKPMPESHCNQTDAIAIVWLPQESSSCMPHEISWKPPTYKNIPLGTGIAEEGARWGRRQFLLGRRSKGKKKEIYATRSHCSHLTGPYMRNNTIFLGTTSFIAAYIFFRTCFVKSTDHKEQIIRR